MPLFGPYGLLPLMFGRATKKDIPERDQSSCLAARILQFPGLWDENPSWWDALLVNRTLVTASEEAKTYVVAQTLLHLSQRTQHLELVPKLRSYLQAAIPPRNLLTSLFRSSSKNSLATNDPYELGLQALNRLFPTL